MSSAETPYQSVILGGKNKAAAPGNSIYSAIIERLGCDDHVVGGGDGDDDEARLKILNTIQSQRYPQDLLTLLSSRLTMSHNGTGSPLCASNCSGHGDCYDGTCFCQVILSFVTCVS